MRTICIHTRRGNTFEIYAQRCLREPVDEIYAIHQVKHSCWLALNQATISLCITLLMAAWFGMLACARRTGSSSEGSKYIACASNDDVFVTCNSTINVFRAQQPEGQPSIVQLPDAEHSGACSGVVLVNSRLYVACSSPGPTDQARVYVFE